MKVVNTHRPGALMKVLSPPHSWQPISQVEQGRRRRGRARDIWRGEQLGPEEALGTAWRWEQQVASSHQPESPSTQDSCPTLAWLILTPAGVWGPWDGLRGLP